MHDFAEGTVLEHYGVQVARYISEAKTKRANWQKEDAEEQDGHPLETQIRNDQGMTTAKNTRTQNSDLLKIKKERVEEDGQSADDENDAQHWDE